MRRRECQGGAAASEPTGRAPLSASVSLLKSNQVRVILSTFGWIKMIVCPCSCDSVSGVSTAQRRVQAAGDGLALGRTSGTDMVQAFAGSESERSERFARSRRWHRATKSATDTTRVAITLDFCKRLSGSRALSATSTTRSFFFFCRSYFSSTAKSLPS